MPLWPERSRNRPREHLAEIRKYNSLISFPLFFLSLFSVFFFFFCWCNVAVACTLLLLLPRKFVRFFARFSINVAWHTHLSQTTLYCPPPTTMLLVAKTIIQPSFLNTISLFLPNCFFCTYIVILLYMKACFICLLWNLIFNLAAWIVERSIHSLCCWHRILISLNLKWTINTYGVKSKTDSFCKYSKKLPNFPVQWSKQRYKNIQLFMDEYKNDSHFFKNTSQSVHRVKRKYKKNPKLFSLLREWMSYSLLYPYFFIVQLQIWNNKKLLFSLVFLSGSSALKVSVYVSRYASLWSACWYVFKSTTLPDELFKLPRFLVAFHRGNEI